MRVNRLIFRNIMPFGDDTVEIPFDGDIFMWLVMGDNGAGKSTMLRMLKLLLYQEYESIPVDEIANEINKNGYIGGQINSHGEDWYLEMGFKPNYLKVYKGTEPNEDNFIDTGKIPDTKKYISQSVVDMPFYVFNNIISLSINDFKSFLKMSPKDTRNIRDRIFNFYAVNEMNDLHKSQIKDVNEKLSNLLASIEEIRRSRESTQEKYNELKVQLEDKNKDRVAELEADILRISEEITACENSYGGFKKEIEYCETQIKANEKIGIVTEVNILTEELTSKEKILGEKQTEKSVVSEEVSTLLTKSKEAEYIKTLEQIEDINKKLDKTKEKLDDVATQYRVVAAEYKELKELIETNELNVQERDRLINLRSVTENIISLHDEKGKHNKAWSEENLKKSAISKKHFEDSELYNVIVGEIRELDKKVKLFDENEQCPTCGSDLKEGDNSGKLREMNEELDSLKKKKEQYSTVVEESRQLIEQSDSVLEEFRTNIISAQSKIDAIQIPKHDILPTEADFKLGDIDHASYISKIDEKLSTIKITDGIDNIKQKSESLKEKANNFSSDGKILKSDFERISSELNETKAKLEGLPKPETISDTDSYTKIYEELADSQKKMNSIMLEVSNLGDEVSNMKFKENSLNEKLAKYSQIGSPELDVDEANQKKDEITKDIETLTNEMTQKKENREKLKLEHKSLTDDEFLKSQLKSFSEMIDNYNTKLKDSDSKIDEYRRSISYNELITKALSDSGIKAHIMKEIVPYLNYVIDETLTKFGLPIEVKFDNEFTPTIFRRGREVSINSISTGMRNITDLAILFSIIKLIVIRFKGINFVQFDEILGSISEKNRIIVLDCLKNTYCDEMKMHVFIVNHFFLPGGYIDKVIDVRVVDGFSTVNIMNPDEMMEVG